MALGKLDIFTGEELQEALALARNIIAIGIEKKNFYKKDALEKSLKEADDLNVKDKLEYIYRFLMQLSLLSFQKYNQKKE